MGIKEFLIQQLEKVYTKLLSHVPIENIRTESTPDSIKHGWAHQPIHCHPSYPFFKLYLEGNPAEALQAMSDYYYNRAIHNGLIYVSKKEGGIKGGSAYQTIVEIHRMNGITLDKELSNLDLALVAQGFEERIRERFKMIDSIKNNGFKVRYFIHAEEHDALYVLSDGHHRAVALYLLGYTHIPLNINQSPLLNRLRRIFRSIH